MDTIGSIVDKLATVNNKMFFNQEFLYEIRKMDFDEFMSKYHSREACADLFDKLRKVVDLNLQRQALILEHDKLLVQMILDIIRDGATAAEKYVVDQHKTSRLEKSDEAQ